ncbi:MAG: ATP-binding protein [Chloroflexi bacterium]|nr:ATP-binding protein [Chloroflexota bacterium]
MVARYDRAMQSAGGPDRPILVVVSGAPGSGKTTLATRLSEELGLILLARDPIKEALGDAVGRPDDVAGSQRLGRAAYAALFALAAEVLGTGRGVVLESNFRRGSAEPEIAALGTSRDTRLVHCTAPPDLIARRYRSRFEAGERHPVHLDGDRDDALRGDLVTGRFDPIELGCPTLVVDTSSGYRPSLEAILAFVRSDAATVPAA